MTAVPYTLWQNGYIPTSEDLIAAFDGASYPQAVAYVNNLFSLAPSGFFYQDDGALVRRLSDRLFVGAAADNQGKRNRLATPNDWLSTVLSSDSIGPWSVWGATFASLSRFGTIGALGASRTSDAVASATQLGYVPASIGVCGFAIGDDTSSPTTATPWAGYFHYIREPGVAYQPGFGIEVEVEVRGSLAVGVSTPYHINVGGGGYGIQIGSGGGSTSSTVDAAAVLTVVRNPAAFQRGIVFKADAITGTDGTIGDTGFGEAIGMGRNQGIVWYTPDGNSAAFIRSTVTTSSRGSRIEFQNDAVVFSDANGQEIAAIGAGGGAAFVKASASFEVGSLTQANTPILDFHSSGNNIDYDVRLIASGGTTSTGQGSLDVFAGLLTVNGAFHVLGDIYSTGDTNHATLGASGAVIFGSTLHTVGAVTFDGALGVGGLTTLAAATLSGVFTANGPANCNSTLNVTGATTVANFTAVGTIAADSDLNVAGTLHASAATTLGGTVAVSGAATLNSTLAVVGGTSLAGLNVSGAAHGATLTLTGGAGFFGASVPGSQPATPVTLADVIAVVRAYGLAA